MASRDAISGLTKEQVATLEALLRAGFRFVTVERVERYLGVEKNGFIALLDLAGGKLALFGSAGYRMGQGIGMLVERAEGKAFVWKQESVAATPELLATYANFKQELASLLRSRGEKLGARS